MEELVELRQSAAAELLKSIAERADGASAEGLHHLAEAYSLTVQWMPKRQTRQR